MCHTSSVNVSNSRQLWAPAMAQALQEAARAGAQGDVPVGAVVLDSRGQVVSTGRNQREAQGDPLSHAEMEALRSAASALGTWNLSACTLLVTLEPCPMCAGAALSCHIDRIVFGAWDPKMGACGSVWDLPRDPHIGAHPEIVGGFAESDCAAVLNDFFAARRR
ncbi:tRNA-specific adenosine deaminase [Bombiscardovia nodaiensis]|uniref:tRNA-specific adenosine deaminase n=1 Tax=Bombiscardovia nodaiensis TaxID=2932181 RepID=A0ABM8B657_9BIFI|nr:tRNA-specific adenosine deaminase [Bombiscardovia nodaiensis]